MRTEKLEQAKQIAKRHIEVDSDVRRVMLLELPEHEEDNPDEPIKLLEVVEGSPKWVTSHWALLQILVLALSTR